MGKKQGSRKRTKSAASPDSVSVLPEKRSLTTNTYEQTMAQTPIQDKSSNPGQGYTAYLPVYPSGHASQFYQSPQQMYMTPPPFSQNASPPGLPSINIQLLFEKLESKIDTKFDIFDKKLQKWDLIESQIASLTQKITSIDTKVVFLEGKVNNCQSKVNEIEASRAFDSSTCDEIRSKHSLIEKQLEHEKNSYREIKSAGYDKLKSDYARVSEDLIDVQSRSMRDNLLFFDFTECETATERKGENCEKKILDFCTDALGFADAHNTLKIESENLWPTKNVQLL
jgi:hypothetical protein